MSHNYLATSQQSMISCSLDATQLRATSLSSVTRFVEYDGQSAPRHFDFSFRALSAIRCLLFGTFNSKRIDLNCLSVSFV